MVNKTQILLDVLQSEERGKDVYEGIEKPQDTRIARSAGNSLDKLATNTSGDPDGESFNRKQTTYRIQFDGIIWRKCMALF